MDNNIEDKLKNLEEWNEERARVKPFIDMAVDYHNRARAEAHWKHYEKAADFYREAIKNYRNALGQNPKYYLQDLLERIDYVIGEHVNNTFNLKSAGYNLKSEAGIRDFVNFVDNMKEEERKYIELYDIAQAYLNIANFYYEEKNIKRANEFYNRVIDANCDRFFVNRDAYFKIAKMQFDEARFKEALVSFVSVLSYDRDDKEALHYLERCLKRLGILEHKAQFLNITPNEAKKLIMEVL